LACALEDLERSTGLWERTFLPRRHEEGSVLLRTHPATAERARRLRLLEPNRDIRWRSASQPRVVVRQQETAPRDWPRRPGDRW